MANYFMLFIGEWSQFTTIFLVLFCWICLAGVGRLFFPNTAETTVLPILGWSIISGIFILFGVLTVISFTLIFWFLAGLAIFSLIYSHRKTYVVITDQFWKCILLVIPVLLLIGAMEASQWDEFSHWLPAQRFLLDTGLFPSEANPSIGTPMYTAYPFAWPILAMLPSFAIGQMLEMSGAIFNFLMLLTIGMLATKTFIHFSGFKSLNKFSWGLPAFSILFGTALNPTFVQKIVITNYADISTACCTAIAVFFGWKILNFLSDHKSEKAKSTSNQLGMTLALLVNIKQSNLEIFGILILILTIISWSDKSIKLRALAALIPRILFPAIILYLLWRYHVSNALGQSAVEASFMPFDHWNFGIIHLILKQMLFVAGKKIAFFGLMAIATFLAFKKIRNIKNDYDRLVIIVATLFIGHNAFLLLTYVGTFGELDALRVVSYWRYNSHIGLAGVLFFSSSIGVLYPAVLR